MEHASSSSPEKICAICGEDCAGQPRIRDPQGRYYHKSCHEEARRIMEQRRAEAAGGALAIEPSDEDDLSNLLEDAIDQSRPAAVDAAPPAAGMTQICTNCGAHLPGGSVICTNCGYNMQTGKRLKSRKSKERAGVSEMSGAAGTLLSPTGIGLGCLAFFLVLFLLGYSSEPMAWAFVSIADLFGLAIWIAVLVFAFKESLTQGFLTLCVPCYLLYFVFGVCENGYVKWLYFNSLLTWIGTVVLDVHYQLIYLEATSY
jgi:ribosomal protein L40E